MFFVIDHRVRTRPIFQRKELRFFYNADVNHRDRKHGNRYRTAAAGIFSIPALQGLHLVIKNQYHHVVFAGVTNGNGKFFKKRSG
jgi:hypothetical protein